MKLSDRIAYALIILVLMALIVHTHHDELALEKRVRSLEADRARWLRFHESEAAILQGHSEVLTTLGMDYAERQGIAPRSPKSVLGEPPN